MIHALVAAILASVLSQSAPASRPSAWAFFVMDNGIKDEKHRTPDSQARAVKELGLDGMSQNVLDGVPELLAALDREGLTLFALYAQAHLDVNTPKYDTRLPGLIKLLKGRPTAIMLTLQSGTHRTSQPEGDPRAVEIVRELAEMAGESRLTIALYPHTGFWMERVEDAVRIAKKANRPNVGVTFNLCHWLKVDKPNTLEARLQLAKPYLFEVTINGADADGTNWDTLIQPLDRGSFDVGILLKTLWRMGYTGPVGLQCYNVKGDKYENLKRSVAAWRRLRAQTLPRQE